MNKMQLAKAIEWIEKYEIFSGNPRVYTRLE